MRVFIVSSHSLFAQGMEEWLRQQAGLDIVGRESDMARAAPYIEQLQPDLILFDISDEARDPTAALIRFVRDRLDTKIVGVHLRDSCICIYCKRQHLAQEVRGLLEVIEEAGFPTPT
jgi:DNA-binding NarL/FixJ family response regulator